MDNGAPASRGGIENAMRLCSYLIVDLIINSLREEYYHAFGEEGGDYRRVVGIWYLTVSDRNRRPTTDPFDPMQRYSTLLFGLDTLQDSATNYLSMYKNVIIHHDMDNHPRIFPAYLSKDEKANLRSRAELVTHQSATVETLMANEIGKYELNLVKKIHRFTHVTDEQMRVILSDAGRLTLEISKAFYKVIDLYPIRNINGRRLIHKKVSLSHLNEAFNQEILADYTVVYIHGEKFEVLNIIDVGT